MKYFTLEFRILRHCLVMFMLRPWWYLLSFDGGYQISHWYLYQQKGFHTSLHIVTGTWNTGDIHAASPHHPPVMVTSSIVTAKTWGNLLCWNNDGVVQLTKSLKGLKGFQSPQSQQHRSRKIINIFYKSQGGFSSSKISRLILYIDQRHYKMSIFLFKQVCRF